MAGAAKSSGEKKKRVGESETWKSEKLKRIGIEDDDFGADLSNEFNGIMKALQLIREKAQKDGQKKNEETISSVASEIKSNFDELRTKLEKDRQGFSKALSKSSKECENLLKNETTKFQAVHENFCKEKTTHLQALKDVISKYEEQKEKLFLRYDQLRKKEKSMIAELEKACASRIADLEVLLMKKKQDDKTFSILRKTLGSFLDNASDEDFPPDD
ncbi:hypothetical protein ACH5RR_015101 [Cinchona calisaya]|uniref:Uncharacterized protein n=1 Tax=Cinchona calisaya TaxID=153742 RepID=A0ABD2ZS62_9GENT